MDLHKFDRLPARIQVSQLVSSRYDDLYAQGLLADRRPSAWEMRRTGIDLVVDADGRIFKLQSGGQQSPPQPGWVIVLRGGSAEQGYEWTLHGFA